MTRTFLVATTVALLVGTVASGQQVPTAEGPQPTQPKPAQATQAPRAPEPSGQAVNIKIDLTITDSIGPGEPTRRVISLVVADRQNGYIRSRGNIREGNNRNPVTINVDARPAILKEGTIRLELGLEYHPAPPVSAASTPASSGSDPSSTNFNERIGVILEPGKPLVVSQAVDPASDRKMSVEVRATILK